MLQSDPSDFMTGRNAPRAIRSAPPGPRSWSQTAATASWVLAGTGANPAFDSAARGAGRLPSRKKAKARELGHTVRRKLEMAGISVRPGSVKLLSEEAPYAYEASTR